MTESQNSALVRLYNKDIIEENAKKKDQVCLATSERIRGLLKADNFSILTGAGSSVILGGPLFAKNQLASEEKNGWVEELFRDEFKSEYEYLLVTYKKYREEQQLPLDFGVEDFITFLFKIEYVEKVGLQILKAGEFELHVNAIKERILTELKKKCSLDLTDKAKLQTYRTFLKRIISRPTNLRRANLFTTNYDLVFETVMDEMGLIYVDGFVGGLRHFFNPQAFNYDYYYPGNTTEGKVSRMEKVLHYYKLHGSLNWVESDDRSPVNVYGIEKKHTVTSEENALIYPTPMKEQDTIGYPYAEMFRRFANAIQQPQSVLITYGYSFGDSHINRIIYEALSVPSFQLVIVSYSWTDSIRKIYELLKEQPSIGFIIGQDYANWDTFVNDIIPDLPTVELEDKYEEKRLKAKILKEQLNASAIEQQTKEQGNGK